jgi:hypothetical protein
LYFTYQFYLKENVIRDRLFFSQFLATLPRFSGLFNILCCSSEPSQLDSTKTVAHCVNLVFLVVYSIDIKVLEVFDVLIIQLIVFDSIVWIFVTNKIKKIFKKEREMKEAFGF